MCARYTCTFPSYSHAVTVYRFASCTCMLMAWCIWQWNCSLWNFFLNKTQFCFFYLNGSWYFRMMHVLRLKFHEFVNESQSHSYCPAKIEHGLKYIFLCNYFYKMHIFYSHKIVMLYSIWQCFTCTDPLPPQMLYRDRAKERRAKYGTDAIVPGWKKRFERERARTAEDEPQSVVDMWGTCTYSTCMIIIYIHGNTCAPRHVLYRLTYNL